MANGTLPAGKANIPDAISSIGSIYRLRVAHLVDRPQICRHLRDGPVSAPYVLMILNRITSKAGIKNRIYLHGLHHTHALELALESHAHQRSRPAA